MQKTVDEIQNELSYFTGTNGYHQYKTVSGQEFFLTDGIQYLCKTCECYWFLDYIFSYQIHPMVLNEEFQVWRLYNLENRWNIVCSDGNKRILLHGSIEFSDFPLDGISVWLVGDVVLLPSEY